MNFHLYSPFIKALKDFELVNRNDVMSVAISGGKDSLVFSKTISRIKKSLFC